MFKSEHNYKPRPGKAPCFSGFLCKHHNENKGKCRNTCTDYIKYEELKHKVREAKAAEFNNSDYKVKGERLGKYQ